MPPRLPRTTWLALALALGGYWSPWLTHPAAALRLNGFELSEWVTFLPSARDGSLAVGRFSFLAPLVCLSLLLSLAAAHNASPPARLRWLPPLPGDWTGWGLLGLAWLCNAALFPAYPYILTAYREPEFQAQFFVACVLPLGLLLTLYLPVELNALLQSLLAGVGGAYGLWTLLAVRPAAAELFNRTWATGLGWLAMLAGFAGLVMAGLTRLFSSRPA